jgi:hypothetical protein
MKNSNMSIVCVRYFLSHGERSDAKLWDIGCSLMRLTG